MVCNCMGDRQRKYVTFSLLYVIIKPYMSICRKGWIIPHDLTKRRNYHWQEQVRKRIQRGLLHQQGRRRQHRKIPAVVPQRPIVPAVRPAAEAPVLKAVEPLATALAAAAPAHAARPMHAVLPPTPAVPLPAVVRRSRLRLRSDLSTRVSWDRRSHSW